MKTKKRLQKLIAAAAMMAMVCGCLPAVYADSANSEETLPSYKASDYYPSDVKTNANAANPYEVDGEKPWQWDYYDMETKQYKPMKRTDESASSGCFASHSGYGNVTRMDATTMHGDARDGSNKNGTGESNWIKPEGTAYAGAWQQYYPVRSFTAPQTGNITITEADGKVEYAGAASDKYGVDFRILLESGGQTVQIWPESGYAHASKSYPISFSAMTLNIQQGDILRFEMYTPNAASNGTDFLHAKWNPVVSYNSYSFVTEYQASKKFIGATVNLSNYNPGDNWDWNCYVYGEQITWSNKNYPGNSYSPMTVSPSTESQKFSDVANYPIPDGETVVSDVYAISGDGVGIGKYWMRGFRIINSSTGKQDYFGRVYAVRTFKAKEAGEVTISAVDRFGKSAIEGSHVVNASNEKNQRGVRVVKESGGEKIQLWPTEQNKGSLNTTVYNDAVFALVPKNLTIDFPTLTTTLQTGDKLHFELANVSPDPEDDSKYGCAVYWDPKVSYTTGVVAKGADVTFKNEDGNLIDFSSIVNSEKDVTVTIPAVSRFKTADSVTPIVAVYKQDGILVSSAVGETVSLAMNKPAELTVNLTPITGNKPADGYIKVFLWDSVERLIPLSDIGAKPVLGTAAGNAAAVYAGTGEAGENVALLIKDENDAILHIEQDVVDEAGRFHIFVPG